jgi:hypothetical protein
MLKKKLRFANQPTRTRLGWRRQLFVRRQKNNPRRHYYYRRHKRSNNFRWPD